MNACDHSHSHIPSIQQPEMSEKRILSCVLINWSIYLLLFCCLLSPIVLVTGQSSCAWCRRVSSNSAVQGGVCNTCIGSESLCSDSSSIIATCSSLDLLSESDSNTYLTGRCSGSLLGPSHYTVIRLDDFLGNVNGRLTIGETGFSQTCSPTLDVSNGHVYLNAQCRNVYGQLARSFFDLNAILANVVGNLQLIPGAKSSPPSDPTYLPACTEGCREGFLRTTEAQCVRCNETVPIVPGGQYCDGIAAQPQTCPVGYYCSGADNLKQLCQAGCLCEQGSSTACPKPCQGGKWCSPGKDAVDCPASYYCPVGLTDNPLPCDVHCICEVRSTEACPVPCPVGKLCFNSSVQYCQPGQWCENSVTHPCPAGTYGDRYGLRNDACAGKCGIMWTSDAGSSVCDKYSQAGMFLLAFIPFASLVGFSMIVAYITAKVLQYRLSKINLPTKVVDASSPERDRIQRQIRNSVNAFVTRVVKLSFPSILNLSSTLLQLKLSKPEHVNASMNEARDDLFSHLVSQLMAHPQVSFDDDSYPWLLPRWASQDPESVEGECEIVSASNTLATGLKSAVEQDLLEWFRSRNAKDNDSGNTQSAVDDEAKESLIVASESSDDPSSSWSTVDHELSIGLRTMLSSSSACNCLSKLRLDYSASSPSHKVFTRLFLLIFECIAITACIKCFIRDPLLKVDGSRRFQFSWDQSGPQPVHWWWDLGSADASIFQPVTDQCTGLYGRVYFALHVIACVLFFILALIDFISWCDAVMQCSRLGRGCRHRMRLAWNQHMTCLLSFQQRLQEISWSKYEGVEAIARVLSSLCLAVAITVYTSGCIVRMKLTPSQAISTYLSRPPEMTYFPDGHRGPSSYDPLTDPAYLNFSSSVLLGAAFIFSIVAMALSMLSGIICVQCWYQSRKQVSSSNQERNDLDQDAAASNVTNAVVMPASRDSGAEGSSGYLAEPSAVVFHTDEVTAIAEAVESKQQPDDEDGDLGIESISLREASASATEIELSVLTPNKDSNHTVP